MSDLGETSYPPPTSQHTHTHTHTHTQAETAVGCLGPLLEHLLFAHPVVSDSFLPHGL